MGRCMRIAAGTSLLSNRRGPLARPGVLRLGRGRAGSAAAKHDSPALLGWAAGTAAKRGGPALPRAAGPADSLPYDLCASSL